MALSPQSLLWGSGRSHGSVGNSGKSGRHCNSKPRVVEAIPKEQHLIHRWTQGLDLQEEFRNVLRDEETRFQFLHRAPPEPEPRSIFVIPKLPQQRRSLSASSVAEPKSPAESAPRRKPTAVRPFQMPQDPMTFLNPHVLRQEVLEAEITEQEQHLARSRSESALRLSQGFEAKAPDFHWDRQRPGVFLTENQVAFFPRSVDKVKEFGSGKESRNCRPYDETYLHREALIRQKHVQR
mmetsp:Transcript_36174/g.104099  ORF Transcript_36174/g.104099 Transcript_36174/m.104099 type:complete len:237 (-) Transcript_36174:140-850(-)